ncbi:hypothetical protein D8W71_20615 [Rhodococcus sp. P1Y]|nr:hypothetical protein D8W71_20615 [Rhodococcus sp. P1Y]
MRETRLAEIYGFAIFYLVGTAAIFTAVLWGVYRFTRFGMATRAAAENERGTALLGYWLAFIGGTNWALGSMLAPCGIATSIPIGVTEGRGNKRLSEFPGSVRGRAYWFMLDNASSRCCGVYSVDSALRTGTFVRLVR